MSAQKRLLLIARTDLEAGFDLAARALARAMASSVFVMGNPILRWMSRIVATYAPIACDGNRCRSSRDRRPYGFVELVHAASDDPLCTVRRHGLRVAANSRRWLFR